MEAFPDWSLLIKLVDIQYVSFEWKDLEKKFHDALH